MTKVFLDTNIFVRFLTPETTTSHNQCVALVAKIESGELTPYSSTVVFLELFYVLTRIYKQNPQEVAQDISKLSRLRNITVIERTSLKKSLDLFIKSRIKFADCLIATQVPAGVTLCTYDTDFAKLPNLQVTTPSQLLQ